MKKTMTALVCLVTTLASVQAWAKSSEAGTCADPKKKVGIHIEIFDDLDLNVITNQKWDEIKKSHSRDILVHWPDGHTTKGIEKHIEDLKAMFISLPDTRVTAHPVKFGSDDWTSVIGNMEGSFTKPMNIGGPTPLAPNGNKLSMQMVTVGHWNKDCVMDEEYLFWDNASYMKQLGLSK